MSTSAAPTPIAPNEARQPAQKQEGAPVAHHVAPKSAAPSPATLELRATFRFYLAVTVFANLAYGLVLSAFLALALSAEGRLWTVMLLPPAMISTGFATLSAFGIAETRSLHRALKAADDLPQRVHSQMLVVQTALTTIFHGLVALILFSVAFFGALGVL